MNVTVTVQAGDGTTTQIVVPVTVNGIAALPAGVTLKDIDGGPAYWDKWPAAAFPGAKTIFPIGRWAPEGLDTQASLDANKGIVNCFMNDGYTYQDGWWQVNLNSAGYYAFGDHKGAGGYFVTDEVDQWAGNGWGKWSGQIGYGTTNMCTDGTLDCGFTALKSLYGGTPTDKPRWTNWGKYAGTQSGQADYQTWAGMTDMLSCDVYFEQENILQTAWWGVTGIIVGDYSTGDLSASDPRIRLTRNYGRLIRHQRDFVGYTKPVWGFHELVNAAGTQVDPKTFTAGLWSDVISGARGIIYFTHNYIATGGMANSFADPNFAGVLAAAQSFYTTTQSLATVLNSPDAVGLVTSDADQVTVTGWPAGCEYLAKWNNGKPYIFAHHAGDTVSNASVTFTLAGGIGKSVTVVNENRTITVVGGKFTDTFADTNTVHIYQVNL